MTIDQFTERTFSENDYLIRPRIYCKDGFTMSVQGSNGMYCSPRQTLREYNSMEIGFPSQEEPLIIQYAESPEKLTETDYGYVPVDLIQQVIEKHGGIDESKTFQK